MDHCVTPSAAGFPVRAPAVTHRRVRWVPLVGAGLLALGGCASVMRVDNQVESHVQWPSTAIPTGKVSYQFERLPSQQSPRQDELERGVAEVLAAQGWTVKDTTEPAAPWRVTVSASHTALPRAPWEEPARDRLWPRWGVQMGTGSLRHGMLLSMDMPYHLRQVSVVVRDGPQGRVVYETQARHEGRWNDTPALWQAMVQAALSGFPQPPAGVRQVDIDLPR